MTELTQRSGSVTCAARSAAGCLRVATAIGPDVVVLDPTLPRSLESHLRAHPVSAKARILHLSPAWAPSASRPAASGRPPAGLQWLRAVQAAAGLARLARDALT